MQNNLEKLTKLNILTQNQRLRLFSKVDITTKLKIIEQQNILFHKLKCQHNTVTKSVLTLCSLILAVDEVTNKLDSVTINASKLNNKSVRAKSKRDKIISYWAIIRTLKLEQNMSFRQITVYLKKHHKLSAVHSTISTIWNELEK